MFCHYVSPIGLLVLAVRLYYTNSIGECQVKKSKTLGDASGFFARAKMEDKPANRPKTQGWLGLLDLEANSGRRPSPFGGLTCMPRLERSERIQVEETMPHVS